MKYYRTNNCFLPQINYMKKDEAKRNFYKSRVLRDTWPNIIYKSSLARDSNKPTI